MPRDVRLTVTSLATTSGHIAGPARQSYMPPNAKAALIRITRTPATVLQIAAVVMVTLPISTR